MSNIAEIGGANVERKIGKASVRDAIIGTGVAIDKMLALLAKRQRYKLPISYCLPSRNERNDVRCTISWTRSQHG